MNRAPVDPYADAIRADPPEVALEWAARQVGEGARVERAELLPGGTSSAVHALDVRGGGGVEHLLVLRRFVRADWLAEEPDVAEQEARVLRAMESIDSPTPALVGVDATGGACDVPAVLMTRLPGRVELAPADEDAWLQALAAPLAHIHAATPGEVTRRYRPWYDLAKRVAPSWSRERAAWRSALRALEKPRPAARECLIHRDYHPANVLFQGGRLSAVLDWVNACRGPAAMDVAHCRLNLVSLRGVEAADRFGALCAAVDPAFEPHPYWDLLGLMEILPGPFEPWVGWVDLGSAPTLEQMRDRLDRYVCSLVDRLPE